MTEPKAASGAARCGTCQGVHADASKSRFGPPEVGRARAAMRMLPMLSEIDQDKGVMAVMDALRAIGVVKYDGERDRLTFRAIEVSSHVLDTEIRKRLES